MTRLQELICDELTEIANSSGVPADIGARAITGGRRRRRRAWTAAVAVAAGSVAVAVVLSALPAGIEPAGGARANALFAWFEAAGVGRPGWHVLDPVSGEYRAIDVATVTAPTTDLRYAAVSAPWTTEVGPGVSPDRRIGRYDTTTGEIRWYDIPVLLGSAPRISPDGRYAAAAADNPSQRPEDAFAHVVVLDLTTGQAATVDLAPADAAAAVYTVNGRNGSLSGFHPDDGLTWRPDSRHLMVGNAIVDLTGHHAGTLPLPPDSEMISVRPDGAAALVDPDGPLFDTDRTYEVTDATGAVVHLVTVPTCYPAPASVLPTGAASPGPSGAASPDPSGAASPDPSGAVSPDPSDLRRFTAGPLPSDVDTCSSDQGQFVGWRGTDAIVVLDRSTQPPSLAAVDLRTGARHRLTRLSVSFVEMTGRYAMVVVATDALSDRARGQVGF